MGSFLRRLLYRLLPLRTYLWVLSRFYFISFRSGWLKKDPNYAYPYQLRKIVRPGDVCLDIGANLGYYAVLLSEIVGEKGRVHAVEPVPPVLSVLRRNTANLDNVTIYPYALGNSEGAVTLGNDSVAKQGYLGSGQHFVLPAESDADIDVEFQAEMRRGSQLFGGLPRLDFVKCDIEGYETVVLPEMKQLLSKYRPAVLLETTGAERGKMIDFFTGMDYLPLVLEKGALRPASAKEHRDILFLPKERRGEYDIPAAGE